MHELAVTESILEIAIRHAQQASAARVADIYLVIGQLSSIVDDSVQFYWDAITEDTICSGAKLHFKRIAARMHCQDCSGEFEMASQLEPCPACGSYRLVVTAGEEFYMDSIEVEAG
jgi:hydrogenase nickel incorporation protein HypA/HybF